MSDYFILFLSIPIAFVIVFCFNKIVSAYNRVKRTWSDVLTYERQKTRILDALIKEADNFKQYEQDLLSKITSLRSAIQSLPQEPNGAALTAVEKQTKGLMNDVKIAFEAYPELKSATVVSGLMREIVEQQENVGAALTIFNRGIEEFNNTIQMFPTSLVNQFFNRKNVIEPFTDSESSNAFEYRPNF